MSEGTFALLADIHGNVWALEAVLADIDRRGLRKGTGSCLGTPIRMRSHERRSSLLAEQVIQRSPRTVE